jgi:Domain of unknown function (DUF4268)
MFDWLFQRKADIEAQMGEALVWERLDHRRASRISAVRQNSTIADAAEHGDELRAWLIDHLLRLRSVFGPLLREAFAATAPLAMPEPPAAAAEG